MTDNTKSLEELKTELLKIPVRMGKRELGGLLSAQEIDAIVRLVAQHTASVERKAHMQGWHEGRAAANNPEYQYGYTTGQLNEGRGNE